MGKKFQGQRRIFAALLSLVLGGGCGTQGSDEDTSGRSTSHLEGEDCEVIPPFTPNFQPELQWEWTGTAMARWRSSTATASTATRAR